MKSGFVAIIGRPNAGKSSLINALLGEKISITSYKAQTTRNTIIGILNGDDYQIVFHDTPGIHKANTTLGSYMNKEAITNAEGVDVIYYIVDANMGIQKEDEEILDQVFKYGSTVFLLLNKIDEIAKDTLITRILYASKNYDFKEIIPISALHKENLDELIKTTLDYMQDDLQYYPSDMKTSSSLEFRIAEIIREKVLMKCHKEIPHYVACKIDQLIEKDNKVLIEASIICNKASHKGIIIGHHGKMLQTINMMATKDIKEIFQKKVVLSLFVKVEEDWMNKNSKLYDLGYLIGEKYER